MRLTSASLAACWRSRRPCPPPIPSPRTHWCRRATRGAAATPSPTSTSTSRSSSEPRTAKSLKERGLLRIVWSDTGRRTLKYHQILDEHLALEPDERALLTVLLLRGAQAPGELRTRTERLHGFADRGQVEECLRRMASRPQPLVSELERRPGQQDPRWMHLLGAASGQSSSETDPAGSADSSRIRVTQIIADLHVPDLPASRSFYSDYLGLAEEEFNLGWVARHTSPVSRATLQVMTGRLEHLRGSALGFRNLTNYIARCLLETGGFRPRRHLDSDEPDCSVPNCQEFANGPRLL